jgi:2-oxoisovalerate dehydrogenase E1 component
MIPIAEETLADISIDWRKVAYLVLLSRRLDELEVNQLAPQGEIKYQFSAGGHELSQVLLALAMDHPHDAASVYYRSRPFALASGLTVVEALAGGMARSGSLTEGRDTGVMYNLPHRTGPIILPSSGNVGAQYTPAAGWAQAIIYRQSVLEEHDWQGSIAAALGGDGSVASNGFWAALNIATTLRLPMLFFLEDNHYGLSVPSSLQTPGGDITANLAAFGNLNIFNGDGTDPASASELIGEAIRHVRSGSGPSLLRLQVPRLTGHTFIDDQSYKSPEMRAEEAARDPLPRLRAFMNARGMEQDDWDKLNDQVKAELAEALREAESLPEPDPSNITSHRFFQGLLPLQGGLRPESALPSLGTGVIALKGPRINMIDAIRRTIEAEMRSNPRMLVFGEDVGVKGGVHGATLDLQAHFGPERVFDTSLSEDGIIGRSAGMALAGLLPVPEIQFRKYADPAHEQLSDLGTLRWRTAGKFAAPVVVRVPVGFGKKTGDPWHSVSGEAVYAHLPGWRIAYPSNASDAAGLLRSALRGDDPAMFFEHRALLDTPEGRQPYPGDDYCLPFGAAARLSEGDELTLITWGAMVPRCLEATRSFPGRVCLLDLRTIIPWDQQAVLESVNRTGKALVVHEDTSTNGFAAEIIATITENAFTSLDAPVIRLAPPDIPIPYNIGSMNAILPGAAAIRARVAELLAF